MGQDFNVGVADRLLDASDIERLKLLDALDNLVRLPGFVDIDAQIHLAAGPATQSIQTLKIVETFDAQLDLHLREAIQPQDQRVGQQFLAAGTRDRGTVAHPLPRLEKIWLSDRGDR